MTIRGRTIELDDTRLVFVGSSDTHPGVVCVGFRNASGKVTKLALSADAGEALSRLLSNPDEALPLGPFPPDNMPRWQQVIDNAWVYHKGDSA